MAPLKGARPHNGRDSVDNDDENDNTWECVKENAAPLERGRNVKDLETDGKNNMKSDTERRQIEKMTRQFEKLIAPSERAAEQEVDYNNPEDKDPLRHWLSYIKFLQDTYPSDTQHSFLLMERCTRTFVGFEQYRNDRRFVRVCLLYADQTSRPAEVFKFLHSRKIGSKVAIFWAAWAFVAEKSENFAFAEKVFKKAIEKEVEPKKFILDRYKQFNRRMSRHWLNSHQNDNDLDSSREDEGEERGTLNNLTEAGVRTNIRSRIANPTRGPNGNIRSNGFANTASRNNRNRNQSSSNNGQSSFSRRVEQMNEKSRNRTGANKGFTIFVDEDTNNGSDELDDKKESSNTHRRALEREADQRKENTMDAETWNKRGGLDNPFTSESTSEGATNSTFGRTLRPIQAKPFDVFVDEECENDQEETEKAKASTEQGQQRKQPSMRERTGDGVAEKLSKDPLRYVNNPSKYAADNKFGNVPGSRSFANAPYNDDKPAKRSEHHIKSKPLRPGYNSSVIKDQDGNEQSLEEARAYASYFTILPESTNVNFLLQQNNENDTSAMSMATETFHGVPSPQHIEEESSPLHTRKESEKRVAFAIHNEGHNNQSGISQATNASSVINEQFATGGVQKKEEETINTKLAAAELSVFFASPSPSRGTDEEEQDLDNDKPNEDGREAVPFKILDETELNGDDDSVQNSIVGPRKSPTKSSPVLRETVFGSRTRGNLLSAADSTKRQEKSLNRSSFFVYKDDTVEMKLPASDLANPLGEEKGDTATFSLLNELCGSEGKSSLKPNDEQSALGSKKRRPFAPATTTESKRLKDSSPNHSKAIDEEKGDTATFSILDELNNEGLKMKSTTDDDLSPIIARGRIRKDGGGDMSTPKDPSSRDICDFGNLSGIQENEISFHRTKTPGLNPFTEKKRERKSNKTANVSLFDYKEIQSDSITLAMDEVVLERNVIDCRGQSLPAALNRKRPTVGAELIHGNATFIVQHELGRGAFGIVLLCRREENGVGEQVALKIQSPTDCLVHEFRILSLLSERVKDPSKFAFPRALNYFSYADGSLLSMTSASSSGINLVDLANLHKTKEGAPVPEIIALYYTSRMMQHIETLHEEAQILHCDVKPDNWVLTSLEENSNCDIDANDVLLCDFGKAVDLKGLGMDSMASCKFIGSPVGKDMEPGSLRDGKPWFFDMDLFGLCASSHVLLFGTHMDISKVQSTKRWKLTKSIRRYWQKSLWQEYFDTLLNDCDGGEGVSSIQTLKSLRTKFENYLGQSMRQEELRACLRRQQSFLPKRKES